jgi:hypothetical protein
LPSLVSTFRGPRDHRFARPHETDESAAGGIGRPCSGRSPRSCHPFALRCSLILCMPVRPLHSSDTQLGCAQTEKQKMLRVILALAIVSLSNAISVQRYATQVRTHTLPPARTLVGRPPGSATCDATLTAGCARTHRWSLNAVTVKSPRYPGQCLSSLARWYACPKSQDESAQ